MQYGILLWPHANARYQQAACPLALSELRMMLKAAGLDVRARIEEKLGAHFLMFELDAPSERQLALLSRHSQMYLMGEAGGAHFTPVLGRFNAYLGHDLPSILKYKGKTNESFTRFLINTALLSSQYAGQFDQRLSLFDPMCGRMTTLFEAVNRGYDAYGADVSAREITEGMTFFKKYLEARHFKHATAQESLTLPGKGASAVKSVVFSADADAFRRGDTRTLSVTAVDSQKAAQAFGRNRFHIAAFDMPYGVQHGPGDSREKFDVLLGRLLPQIHSSLKQGGAVALSFNTYTLPSATVKALLAGAGFRVMTGENYEGLAHFVEQAIVRDVLVGLKI